MRTLLVLSALVALATARSTSGLSKLESKLSHKRGDSDRGDGDDDTDVTGWIKIADGCYMPPTFKEVIPDTDIEYTISLDEENVDKLQELLDLLAVYYEVIFGEPTTDETVDLWPGCENLNAEVAQNLGSLLMSMDDSCDAKGDNDKSDEDDRKKVDDDDDDDDKKVDDDDDDDDDRKDGEDDDSSKTSLERLFGKNVKKRSAMLNMFKKMAVKLQKKK